MLKHARETQHLMCFWVSSKGTFVSLQNVVISVYVSICTCSKGLYSLQDILLGLLKKRFSNPAKAPKGRASPLKVLVMSATLETDKLSAFLGDCPVFAIPGRMFPVTSTFGFAVGPKDFESTGYMKEVLSLSIH